MRTRPLHANARRATSVLLAAMLAFALFPVGCTSGGTAGRRVQVDYKESPAKAAARLGKVLSAAKTADEARAAVYESLARTGLAVKTPAGDLLAMPGDRAHTTWVFQEQADNLTLDFLESQGWTAATFTHAISEHPEGPGATLVEKAPEAFGVLLREWAAAGAAAPDDPSSFAPLLLAELAKARGLGSDFTTGTIRPDQIVLTYFEVMVLTSGAFAPDGPAAGTSALPGTDALSTLPAAEAWAALSPFAPAVAYAEDPCSFIKEAWGKDADNFGRKGLDKIWGTATGKVGDWLTGRGMGDLVGGMKSLAGPMKWANLLSNFISLYGGYSIELKWDPSPTHYLGNDGQHGNEKLKVTATVSVRPQADDATLKCLKFAGIDKPTSDSVKNARVQWIPLYGITEHAIFEALGEDRVEGVDVQAVDDSGKAVRYLTMSIEKDKKAKDEGKLKKDQIVIQTDVTTYKPDPSKLMASALFGGVKGGVTEAMKGWITKWFPKRAIARIPVEYHEMGKYKVILPLGKGRVVLFSGQGARSVWSGKFEGEPDQPGSGEVDLTSGNGELRIKYSPDMGDAPVFAQGTLTFQASVGGSQDEPTMVVEGGSLDAVAVGPTVKGQAKVSAGGQTTFPMIPVD
jgi:hypothetical protein